MEKRVTVVITQRESFSRSIESLSSVLAHSTVPYDLIYVDGGSPPSIQRQLRQVAEGHGMHLIRREHFLSPNEARRLACPHLSGEYAAFLDNDVLVSPGWLEALLGCAEETNAAVVAPLYLERVGSEERLHMFGGVCRIVESSRGRRLVVTHTQRQAHLRGSPGRRRTEHVEMHGLLIRSSCLGTTDPFDPQIPSIPENTDFCLRILAGGGTMWIEPQARLTVLLPESIEEMDRAFYLTRWSDAWTERGMTRFCAKWGLAAAQPELDSQRRWAVAHRVVAYADALHHRLGIASDSILNRRLLAPLERRFRHR